MGVFNVVEVPGEQICRDCGRPSRRDAQFRFGACDLSRYRIGDLLHWGERDAGVPGRPLVAARGYGSRCPHCGYNDELMFDVIIEHDIVTAVLPETGKIDYSKQDDEWVVLGR
ncbi:hypothetical protein GCM10017786_47820 [Amycolatopsis deserti]|uniref:Uncharacterized protein n=1 Tax=Amycolatopsis deserti TaxID=185696 RepID=A0ABQ3J8M9_9PSEU|nr:hypothetical protein [Amycolatopsis deserti]GHF08459.1 hypothetical protein GCM10017786_47820 [Amycolatopsis deserti]